MTVNRKTLVQTKKRGKVSEEDAYCVEARLKEATDKWEHAQRVLAIGGTCCAKCCATQEAEEEVERFVRNMARTAVIAEDAFSGVPLQPKRVRLYKNWRGNPLLEYDS